MPLDTGPKLMPGYSLPSEYYTSHSVFKDDLRMIADRQWLMVDHESRISAPGDYFLFDYGDDNVIIIRDREGKIRAHHNVCRHRGSRICLKPEGHVRALTCPYHAWTYDLEGRLLSAAYMPSDFDLAGNGLISCHVAVASGIIFANLSISDPPDFKQFIERAYPLLGHYNLGDAKVGARTQVPTRANWKLVIENFFECYHCKPSHRLYTSIHDPELIHAAVANAVDVPAARARVAIAEWELSEKARGGNMEQLADGVDSPFFQMIGRMPIGRGSVTETVDGKPVAPSMLDSGEYDGAQGFISFNPLGVIIANSDHAVMFRFTPRRSTVTDVEAIYLVHKDAVENKDYDAARLKQFWDVTLAEDKIITENNQLGVNSSVYRPGRYAIVEKRTADFVGWYSAQLRLRDIVDEPSH